MRPPPDAIEGALPPVCHLHRRYEPCPVCRDTDRALAWALGVVMGLVTASIILLGLHS